MALLPVEDRAEVRRRLVEQLDQEGRRPWSLSREQTAECITAVNQWFSDNAAVLNTMFPLQYRARIPPRDKARIIHLVVQSIFSATKDPV